MARRILVIDGHPDPHGEHFVHGLAEITHLDANTVGDLVERRDIDGLAMICRSANIERPLFVTLAVMIGGGDDAMAHAEQYGKMYNSVPVDAAQRAMRFLKVRRAATDQSDAA